MFTLTKFNGEEFLINGELIRSVEAGGDTVITLANGERILVREPPEEVQARFMKYKQEIAAGILPLVNDE